MNRPLIAALAIVATLAIIAEPRVHHIRGDNIVPILGPPSRSVNVATIGTTCLTVVSQDGDRTSLPVYTPCTAVEVSR